MLQRRESRKRIEAVAMDVNTAVDLEVRQHSLQTEVVYDLLHVVVRYDHEVIDGIQVVQANALCNDMPPKWSS